MEYLIGFLGENKGERELPRLKWEWIGGAATHLPCEEKYTSEE
jgi:hypothetical protein